jgi:hypothetical protein
MPMLPQAFEGHSYWLPYVMPPTYDETTVLFILVYMCKNLYYPEPYKLGHSGNKQRNKIFHELRHAHALQYFAKQYSRSVTLL